MKSTLVRIAILFLAFAPLAKAQLTPVGVEQPVTYSGKVASLGVNAPALNFSSPTGTNTFILASQPETAARIYIVNETPNACNGVFQITVATTAQKNIGSFNNNPQNWVAVPIINSTGSYASNSGLVSIPANGSITITSAAIAGQNAAIFVVNTTGACASTSIDVLVEFAVVSITSPLINVASGNNIIQPGLVANVQGIQPVGGSLAAVNPVAIGGKDLSGNNRYYMMANSGDAPGFNYDSMPIGALGNQAVGIGASVIGQTFPKGGPAGPLAVSPMGFRADGGGGLDNLFMSAGTQLANNSNPPNLFVTNGGYVKNSSITGLGTSGQNITLWAANVAGNGVMNACYFQLDTTNVTGTAPTSDAFLQTSNDGVTWTDRIHFNQVATGVSHQYAGLATNTGINPAPAQDRVLAVGTRIDGPMGWFGRFSFTFTGTSPSYNYIYAVSCI